LDRKAPLFAEGGVEYRPAYSAAPYAEEAAEHDQHSPDRSCVPATEALAAELRSWLGRFEFPGSNEDSVASAKLT
jgi:hypothetical protein